MDKYIGIAIGAFVVVLGLLGLKGWWADLLVVLRGSIPLLLIIGGGIAVIAGLSELNDELKKKK
ncbi:MAG: hypothetical protein WC779_02565 [Candidatus Omnitrophota bacterium]|jgi:hypothetical protein